MTTTRPRRSRAALATAATSIGLLALGGVVAPAHAAVVLDATGVEFSFVDPADVLADAAAGESFLYANVATIDGVQVDATVTIEESFNSLGSGSWFFVSEVERQAINAVKVADELTKTGCYADPNEEGMGSDATLPTDYLVGSQDFTAPTSFAAPSDFLTGSTVLAVDEADPADPESDKGIRTELMLCGGEFFSGDEWVEVLHPGFVRLTIDFTSSGTPVQLTNLTLSAFDIDSDQYLRLFSPLPDSYRVFEESRLTICRPAAMTGPGTECDADAVAQYAGSTAFLGETGGSTLEFYGGESSEDGEVFEWAAQATYTEPVSSLSYQYGERSDAGSSSLEVRFEPIDWASEDGDGGDELAETGASPAVTATALVVGLGVIALGLVLVVRAQRRARS